MGISSVIKTIFIRIFALFCFSKRSKVIFYHDIHDDIKYVDFSTPIELFRTHIKTIESNGYEIVSKIKNPIGQIEICFDDGYLGLYENIDLIKELNIPIHLFIVSSYLDKERYINKKQLLELKDLVQVEISSHTHTHKILNQISIQDIEHELKESKEILENLLGNPVDSICFPEGKFNSKVVDVANALGYKKQYCSIPGFYTDEFAESVKKRSLVQLSKEKEFQAILRGGDHILSFWYKLKHFTK